MMLYIIISKDPLTNMNARKLGLYFVSKCIYFQRGGEVDFEDETLHGIFVINR